MKQSKMKSKENIDTQKELDEKRAELHQKIDEFLGLPTVDAISSKKNSPKKNT